jgi:UDP-GlcNAc:undecaprenyl-phosphate GlcNAc-1-phosphate transferase
MNLNLLAATFLLSALIQYLAQKIFIHYKKFDEINHRSSHVSLATRTGGIGIFLTIFSISLLFYLNGIELFEYSLLIPLSIMFIVGVYDDFYNADFKLKFFLQIIVAKILIDQGFVISNYFGLFGLYEIPWLLAQASTIFVFLVVVNAINFIDGIDGLAISQILKGIILIEIFSPNLMTHSKLGLIVTFAIIPLYYFNFKQKNKVFLGDSGSLFLGTLIMIFILEILSSDLTLKSEFNKTLFSVLVLLYPLIDLFRVFYIRVKNRKSPFIADQNHLHHLLIKRYSHKKSIILITISEISVIVLIILVTELLKYNIRN